MKKYLPAVLWGLLILALSISPTVQLPETFFSPDKLGHVIFYGILTWLVIWGKAKEGSVSDNFKWKAVLFCSFYGFIIELIQYQFFPNRYFEFGDIVANIVGCILAKYLFFRFFTLKIKK